MTTYSAELSCLITTHSGAVVHQHSINVVFLLCFADMQMCAHSGRFAANRKLSCQYSAGGNTAGASYSVVLVSSIMRLSKILMSCIAEDRYI